MPAEQSEGLPRRFLPAFLLLSLERHGTSYGYELYETARSLALAVDLAAVYRALRTMHHQDLVTSQWVASASGPDRRLYSLTASGRQQAAAAATELATVRDGLAAALAYFRGRADRGANPSHSGEAAARAARESSQQERETPRIDTKAANRSASPRSTRDRAPA